MDTMTLRKSIFAHNYDCDDDVATYIIKNMIKKYRLGRGDRNNAKTLLLLFFFL